MGANCNELLRLASDVTKLLRWMLKILQRASFQGGFNRLTRLNYFRAPENLKNSRFLQEIKQ